MTTETKEYRGFNWHFETPDKVRDVIADHKHDGKRLRLWLGDAATGKPWLEENDVIGHIGRSTGRIKTALLIHNTRSHGGGAILTHCLVAIQDVKTKQFLYKHDGFTVPQVGIFTDDKNTEYPAYVKINDEIHARFKTHNAAQRYADFMRGKRMSK